MLKKQGMYLPEFEHDNCGAGFICSLEGKKSNDIIDKALQILECLEHRGAVSADGKTGDGAGILTDIPHELFSKACSFEIPEFGDGLGTAGSGGRGRDASPIRPQGARRPVP